MSTLKNLSSLGTLVNASEDERRVIQEINFPESSYTVITVKSVIGKLGKHFHKRKEEKFFFLHGGGTVRVVPVTKKGKISGEVQVYNATVGSVITIPAYHSHDFLLDVGTIMFVYSSAPYTEGKSKTKKDIWPCEIPD